MIGLDEMFRTFKLMSQMSLAVIVGIILIIAAVIGFKVKRVEFRTQ